jgi:tetratricopeptide (TPR) repeat protein
LRLDRQRRWSPSRIRKVLASRAELGYGFGRNRSTYTLGARRIGLKVGTERRAAGAMSRFRNLEFDDGVDGQLREEGVVKNEAFYEAEARAAFAGGRFEQSLRAHAKVLEFNPRNTAAWTGQVRMLIELGEYREAQLWADKALETFPTEPELLAAKAVALARAGDLNGALAFSDAAIEERGDTPYIWLARGDVLLARGEKRAEYCIQKALAIAAHDWFVLWLASRIYYYYEQFANALKVIQRAVELDALRAVLWLQLGRCQFAVGLVNLAQSSWLQARQLDPACREAEGDLIRAAHAGLWTRLRGLWRRYFAG